MWGPAGSFIADNNALALAVIMAVPLFRYLQLQSQNRWVRRGCVAAMVLCVASAVGSQSRGAFLALLAMSMSLWIKGRNKALIGVIVLVAIPLVFAVMPEQWSDRMSTIETYGSDSSAMGRINAWWMAWNLAVSRFPIGGGFTIYNSLVYQRFAPDPSTVLVAHSIYFQILGEHGFMGLAIYLGIFGLAWRTGSAVLRNTKDSIDLGWARDLASMLQVSLIGYAVGGAFLSLAYYDFPYYVVAMLVVLDRWVKSELARVAAGGRGAAQGANQPSTTRALS